MRAKRWAAVLATALAVGVPVSAGASSDLLRTADGSPLAFERLAPGSQRTGDVVVTNPSEGAATIAMQVRITDQREGGCLRQELDLEAARCDDTGELGDWLDVTLTRDDQLLWSGPITALAEPRRLPGSLAAGESWELELGVSLPLAAGNDTMTDRIAFDLVAHAAGATDVLGVDGSAQDDDGGGSGTTDSDSDAGLVPTAVDAGLDALVPDAVPEGAPQWLVLLGSAALAIAAGAAVRRWLRGHVHAGGG